MYKVFCLLFLSMVSLAGMAQKSLNTSRKNSYYTYIYALNDRVVKELYNGNKLNESVLQAPVDSFLTSTGTIPELSYGNYLKVYAQDNELRYSLLENHNVNVKLLDNRKDLQLLLTDKAGNEVSDAIVLLNDKPLKYDKTTGLWRTSYPKKENNILNVQYKGISGFSTISFEKEKRTSFASWLVTKTPVRYICRPFVKFYYKLRRKPLPYSYRRYQVRDNQQKGVFSGFMVFNKPEYKPLDTVKFKAFVLKGRSHRPVAQVLDAWITADGIKKRLGKISPDSKGAFSSSFVLNDSLRLTLDKNYTVQLGNKNKVYRSGSFRYEEYELNSISFSMRGEKEEHSRKEPQSLYFKATDANGLAIMDGRVELNVITTNVKEFTADNIFVPDILWTYKFKLDPLGETKVVLPDSIFPDADIKYSVQAEVFNADNESEDAAADFTFSTSPLNEFIFEAKADSLYISQADGTSAGASLARISAIDADSDTLETFSLQLPTRIKINPHAEEYKVKAGKLSDWFELEDVKPGLEARARRTSDSLFVKVDNPRKIPFWYTVFKDNKIIDRGRATDLFYKRHSNERGRVRFQLNYIWAGKASGNSTEVQFAEKELHIDVKQPLAIAPGETTQLEVTVSDARGKAVENADLTAFSFTGKFKYNGPSVPYFGKSYSAIKEKPVLEQDEGPGQKSLPLNWKRWAKEIGLDSIEYFRFTHPDPIYRHQETAPGRLTQIAPFIVDKGQIVPVEILYIDDKPVYFSKAEQVNRYSFKVKPGLVFIKFRLKDKFVSAQSVLVTEGKKLVISYNLDTLINKSISVSKAPQTLSDQEAFALNNYMIKVEDTYSPRYATINMPDKVYLLRSGENRYWYKPQPKLVGPLSDDIAEFQLKERNPLGFKAEPNYLYSFEPGMIRQKSLPGKYAFNLFLSSSSVQNYTDFVLTNNETDSLWLEYLDMRSHTTELFDNARIPAKGNGKLEIRFIKANKQKSLPLVKNILVYRYDNPDFLNIYAGRETNLGYMEPGKYRLFVLLKEDEYVLIENVLIKAAGVNILQLSLDKTRARDSVSAKISYYIKEKSIAFKTENKLGIEKIKEAFNDTYSSPGSYKNKMSGIVYETDSKEPLPGVSIKVKGRSHAVSSDADGRFELDVPQKGTVIFSYLGYESFETAINHQSGNEVYLKPGSNALQEVVVVGYGSSRENELQQALQGRMFGVSTKNVTSSYSTITIRGASSLNGDNTPLYIVDGIPVNDALKVLKPEDIAELSSLKDESAIAIYGARAANGVIIITTKKGKEKALQEAIENGAGDGVSFRKDFSDYAFWQPRLRSNAEGKIKFSVTFPDDITNWRTFYIAMNGKGQSGYSENSIKAFKPLSTAFVSPQFAITGDSFSPLGKISNYTSDTVLVTRDFSYNGQNILKNSLKIKNAHIDTFKIQARGTDSLRFQYSIQKTGGYSDGEIRNIPLYKAGVVETTGRFDVLQTDTLLNLSFDPALGKVAFRAEASVLPVLLNETEHLRAYSYLCNEQIASKLKALLIQKRIKGFLKEPFENDKAVKELIKKLADGRRQEGTWGWWKNSDAELWISRHAAEACLDAMKSGYEVRFDKQSFTDYLVYELSRYKGMNKLEALMLLWKMDARVDYKTSLSSYEKETGSIKHTLTLYEKLKLLRLKQQIGLPVSTDSLLAYRHSTMFGNMYFGDKSYRFFDNSIQNSLLAYEIIKAEGKHPEWLQKIRNYFLEQRGDGNWRNTYESSLILETILPDILKDAKLTDLPVLTLTGAAKEEIKSFPYSAALEPDTKLQVQKRGGLPIYITAYQQFWNQTPGKVSKDFRVDTWFENKKGTRSDQLKGGEPVVLQARVMVSADADFVMVEIPVPAGCSYDEKEQIGWGHEVHREYFKEKISIFCRKLKEGKYTFSVKLMPRFDGLYTLNPARAELMYFPVFYGREELKKVKVGE